MYKLLIRLLKLIGIALLVLIVFHPYIYNSCIHYKSISQRPTYHLPNMKLDSLIDSTFGKVANENIEQIISKSLDLTSQVLSFTNRKCEIDPNFLIETRKTNCIGYSNLAVTILNSVFKKFSLEDDWTAGSQVGQIIFLGYNLHLLVNDPFFKDHDFVLIKNNKTGEKFAIDPSLSDYSWIKEVHLKNN